ncbi:MAG: polyprenyl synthetase family protein [Deltaproteobacteria bacterium]|nr:MAG: polyprenyl synthetase family protein [Deltaproteobacteria bacterium]
MEKIDLLNRLKPEIDIVDQAMQTDLQNLAGKGLIPERLIEVLEHALFNGGKRIRPLLCILTAGLCGNQSKDIYPLSIAFEYLHVATLLHDDVIDHADTRRGRPAVNKLFGLTPAILAGDFLHARSMYLVGTLGGKRCLELICRATEAMVAGEFLQLANAQNFNQSEKDYFAVINGKTALFIGAVCETGGIFAGASDKEIEALKTYGANLGKAFQIQDDLLDYLGDPSKTGKTVGNDFLEGKMTLPLIYALKTSENSERNYLLELLKGEKDARKTKLEEARDIIGKSGGFDYGRKLAEELIIAGLSGLDILSAKHNEQTIAILTGLAHYVIHRDK